MKVRWGFPGSGKSGAWRFAVIAYCKELRVVFAAGFPRRDNPSDADFDAAFSALKQAPAVPLLV